MKTLGLGGPARAVLNPQNEEEGVGNRGALGKKARMAVWQEGGAGTRLFV